MPKRPKIVLAFSLITITSLIMIVSGSLDGAAAWANIVALPVAIVGVVLSLRGGSVEPSREAQERSDSADSNIPRASAPTVGQQIGFGRQQFNIAGNYVARDRDDLDGK